MLDYKKQWNQAKFERLENMIETLEKEKATLKAKYKHKVVIKTETIRAELSKELHAMTAQYERVKLLLEQKMAELEILY